MKNKCGAHIPLLSSLSFHFWGNFCGCFFWFWVLLFFQWAPDVIAFIFIFYWLIWQREREREIVICRSLYSCIHRLILVCALTRDWILNLGVLGQHSNQLSYPARALIGFSVLGRSLWAGRWFWPEPKHLLVISDHKSHWICGNPQSLILSQDPHSY